MQDSAISNPGIWSHWKLIVGTLSILFVVAVGVDISLWFALNKDRAGMQSLNDIIASQPPAPKTDEEKTALLDGLAAAHQAAVAQVTAKNNTGPDSGAATPTSVSTGETVPATDDPTVQTKIELLDSMQKSPQQ